ncbi:ABC transporter ATP-binding protein [Peptoniphilus sp. DNF00840]|uniref:ABC transporter ATP-binding protein n=1 Tax=Peptoniphilus sp. DNF00840 TaxID=1477000 RepID=UPI000783C255|nr:ATP-binding cassette domain-containing protein [Peptoniphilus sp. DNF00840]KXB70654.1 ABC transporter, ATP-binding protein [Peptoniphilus sp. DNF00840]
MSGIILKDVCKNYMLGKEEIQVIKNLNLEVKTNERTVLIGESGCGKSTLLKLISGLEEVSSGEIVTNKLSTSMVFQNPRLFPWKNVRENIEFSLKNKRDDKLVDEWIKKIKLVGFEGAYPSQLSGGMQSRVSIARALVAKKDYLLMDEPFAAIDGFTRREMQKELLNLFEEEKVGFLFVTHSIEEALVMGTRILIMKQGKIIDDFYLEDRKMESDELKEHFNDLIKGERNEKIS